MKILQVIVTLGSGGAQKLLEDLVPRFNQEIQTDVLMLVDTKSKTVDSLRANGIKVMTLGSRFYYNPLISIKLVKYFKLYDIVHVHLFPTIYWSAIASMFCNTKLVYTEHSTSNRRRGSVFFKLLDKIAYSRYTKVIAISDGTRKQLTKWLDVKNQDSRFVTIQNGIDTEKFREKSLESKRTGSQIVNLLMISRFVKAKDHKTVIKAMQYLDANYHLQFVGDGELQEDAIKYAQELGVDNKISFLGRREDVPSLIAGCDIGIQSSNWEGFGLTAVEFMAAGKPVIVTCVDGLQQVVEGAGLTFDVGDVKTLVDYIKKLATDFTYYNIISDACIQRSKEYDINIMERRYIDLYNTIKITDNE